VSEDRVALVTGSSRGIGRAILERLAADGHACVVHYRRDEQAADDVAATLRERGVPATMLRAELESDDDLDALIDGTVDAFGRLDVVVANAAAGAFRPVTSSQPHHVSRTLETVIGSFVHLARRAAPLLGEGGRIITIGGLDARMAQPGHGLLGAAKAALEALTRSLAVELGPQGTTVNTVVPGPVQTDSLDLYLAGREDLRDLLVRHTPIGRLATPGDVAEAVAFLCSPAAGAINGQVITVDGGLSAQGGPWQELAEVEQR
jgi:enoyl-[acyl-carrier protein] reductase III